MEFAQRIMYSQEQMLRNLEEKLEQLNILRYDTAMRRDLGEEFHEKLNGWLRDIRAQRDTPFTLVVAGDFKRGKSTFINALLGEEVVPTDVTTETVTLNRISYGLHGNEAVLSGSRRVRLADEELKREKLEGLILQAGEPIQSIEIKREIDLLKKITILDTPGTGDAMQDFSDAVKDCLIQADAVVYIYNAQYPLSISEQLFLKSAVLSQKYTSLILVANYADTLGTPDKLERMRGLLKEKIRNLLPESRVRMISALDELCRVLDEERPNARLIPALEAEFDDLRSRILELAEQKADNVMLDRMQRLTCAMVMELNAELDAISKGLDMSNSDAAESMAQLNQQKENCARMQKEVLTELDEMTDLMRGEANRWLREFMVRIENESTNLAVYPRDMLLKHYEFYCVDLLEQAINTCVEYHQELMYEKMEGISSSLSEKFALGLEKKQGYGFRFSLNNRIWTKGDTVGFAVSYASNIIPLLGIGSLVVDGITGAMRESEAKKKVPDVLSQIAAQFPALNQSIAATVDRIYGDMGTKAKKLVQDHFADTVGRAEQLAAKASEVARKAEAEKQVIRSTVTQAKELLERVNAEP